MGWKEQLNSYKTGKTEGIASVDNSVATQVMKGLGMSMTRLPALERACLMNPDFDEPVWPRLMKCLKHVSHGQIGTRMLIDTRSTDENHSILKDSDELFESMKKYPDGMLILCRVNNSKNTIGYVFLHDNGMTPDWILHPKATLLERKNGYCVWCRKIDGLIHDLSEAKKWTLTDNE